MKVFVLVRDLDVGGTQRQAVCTANELAKCGIEVDLVTFYHVQTNQPFDLDEGVRHISLSKRGRWDLGRFFARLVTVLAESNPDVIYSFLDGSNLVAALVLVGCRRQRRSSKLIWGIRSGYLDWRSYDLTARLANRMIYWLANMPDLVIFNSYAGEKYYLDNGFECKQAMVIPNGIDTTVFFPNGVARENIRSVLGIKKDEILVGAVGRLDEIKDFDVFLSVAVRLVDLDKRYTFVLIGSGTPSQESVVTKSIEKKRLRAHVQRIPETNAIADYFNAMDVYCSCSRGEGFPNTVAEAMACGVPCVVTKAGDSEIIIGDTGVAVDPGDDEALMRGVVRMTEVRTSNDQISVSIRHRITSRYSLSQLQKLTVRTIQQIDMNVAGSD